MTSADVMIIGRLLGPAALGLYTVTLNFAALPLSKVAPIVNSVALPAFALVQDRRAEAAASLLKALRLMALLTAPVFLGIAATAPEIVDLVFGPAWAEAKPLLPLLCAALTFRAMLILVPNYLLGMGDAKAAFWCTATGAAVLPAAVLVGCTWGITGACAAWVVAYPVIFGLAALIAHRRGDVAWFGIVAAALRPLGAAAAMVAAVRLARLLMPETLPSLARLAAMAGIGAVVYASVIAFGFPTLFRELLQVIRGRRTT